MEKRRRDMEEGYGEAEKGYGGADIPRSEYHAKRKNHERSEYPSRALASTRHER